MRLTSPWGGIIVSKLNELIESKHVPLGTTPNGRQWAVKALHPADPTATPIGIPDESATPSVFQHYQKQISILNATPGTAGVWSADVYILAHPVIMASICVYDSSGAYSWNYVLNESFGSSGDSYATRKDLFASQVENYRLGYLSATGHLDSAAVTDQGMIAVAQYPLNCVRGGIDASSAAPGYMQRRALIFNELPKTYTQLLTMPNSYTNNAREGCYAVYRLSRTHQRWRNARDVATFVPYGNAGVLTAASTGAAVAAGAPSVTTVSGVFPYAMTGYYAGSSATNSVAHLRCDVNMIHISLQNLHYLSSFVLTLRHGLELQISPGSPLTSFLHAPPNYDPQAIDGYFAVMRELKDAYPEDYNSLGKMAGILWGIVKTVGSFVPGASPVLNGLENAYDLVRRARKDKKAAARNKVDEASSLAAIEDHKAAVAAKAQLQNKPLNSRRRRDRGRSKYAGARAILNRLLNDRLQRAAADRSGRGQSAPVQRPRPPSYPAPPPPRR